MWYRDGSYFPLIVGIWMGTTFVAAEAHPYLLMGRDPPPRKAQDYHLAKLRD